jgi:hypothetical protein
MAGIPLPTYTTVWFIDTAQNLTLAVADVTDVPLPNESIEIKGVPYRILHRNWKLPKTKVDGGMAQMVVTLALTKV